MCLYFFKNKPNLCFFHTYAHNALVNICTDSKYIDTHED